MAPITTNTAPVDAMTTDACRCVRDSMCQQIIDQSRIENKNKNWVCTSRARMTFHATSCLSRKTIQTEHEIIQNSIVTKKKKKKKTAAATSDEYARRAIGSSAPAISAKIANRHSGYGSTPTEHELQKGKSV
jgi:hypothetical protein